MCTIIQTSVAIIIPFMLAFWNYEYQNKIEKKSDILYLESYVASNVRDKYVTNMSRSKEYFFYRFHDILDDINKMALSISNPDVLDEIYRLRYLIFGVQGNEGYISLDTIVKIYLYVYSQLENLPEILTYDMSEKSGLRSVDRYPEIIENLQQEIEKNKNITKK